MELSKKQAVLYRKYVAELEKICNHPDQYLGQKGYEEKDIPMMHRLKGGFFDCRAAGQIHLENRTDIR